MASFLRVGAPIDHASSTLFIATILLTLCVFTIGAPLRSMLPWCAAALTLTLTLAVIEKYFAWRVALDASLFTVLERYPNESAAFDSTLAACLNRNMHLTERTLDDRWRGAKRLLWLQIFAIGLQLIFTFVLLAMGFK